MAYRMQDMNTKKLPEPFPFERHIVICSDCGGYFNWIHRKARGQDYYKCNKKGVKVNHST